MFCDKCEKIFDLDTSFPPDAHREGGPRVAHHKSYWALCQAARAGCEFCQLIVETTRGGSQEMPSHTLPDSKERVSVQFFHDTIKVDVPLKFSYAESEEGISIGGYELARIT